MKRDFVIHTFAMKLWLIICKSLNCCFFTGYFLAIGCFFLISCTKDVKHHLLDDYVVIEDMDASVDDLGIRLSANLNNPKDEEIIDYGFIWCVRAADWYLSESDIDRWINNSSDLELRQYILNNGASISLGKPDKAGRFTCEQSADIIIGRKYLAVAYIKTNEYTTYSVVRVFDDSRSRAWNRKDLSFSIPYNPYFITVNDRLCMLYGNNRIGELSGSDYRLVQGTMSQKTIKHIYFSIENSIFVSLTDNSMWKYDVSADVWTLVTSGSVIAFQERPLFSFYRNQKGYTCFYDSNQSRFYVYSFNVEDNKWSQGNVLDFVPWYCSLFSYKNRVYLFCGKKSWIFDDASETFTFKSDIDFNIDSSSPMVATTDNVYVVTQEKNRLNLFTYDLNTNSTKKLCSLHNSNSSQYSILYCQLIGEKIIFFPSSREYLYELDLSLLLQ